MLGLIKSVDLESLSDESCFRRSILFQNWKSVFSGASIESRKIQIVHEHLENNPTSPDKNTSGLVKSEPKGTTGTSRTNTGSKHMMMSSSERNSISGTNEKNGICQTEIDLSSSCIELIVHRWVIFMSHILWVIYYESYIMSNMFSNDGTIRRKKYRDHPR